jgi:hypothetical protein
MRARIPELKSCFVIEIMEFGREIIKAYLRNEINMNSDVWLRRKISCPALRQAGTDYSDYQNFDIDGFNDLPYSFSPISYMRS